MRTFAFFATVGALCAQGIDIAGSTSTQMLGCYTAPSASACTLTSSPALLDLDATKFTNADQDLSRSTTVANGLRRCVAFGNSSVQTGSDAVRYSRAAYAETAYQLTATCGATVLTGTAVTQSPTMGAVPRKWAGWPSINPASQSTTYADPTTGTSFRIWGQAGDAGLQSGATTAFGEVISTAGSWTNIANAKSAGSSYATSSGAAALVLYPDPTSQNSFMDKGWFPSRTIEDFGVFVSGSRASATGANGNVGVCLTIDKGVSCYTNEITITLPQTTPSTQLVPSDFPLPWFPTWGKAPTKEMWAPYGTVTMVSGAGTIVDTDHSRLSPWMVGSKIRIAGTDPTCAGNICQIASITSSIAFTTVESVSASGAAFYGMTVGVRITKANATSTVDVSAGFRAAGQVPDGQRAESNPCSPLTFVGTGSKTWRICTTQLQPSGSISMYALATDGTVNYIASGVVSSATGSAPSLALGQIMGRIIGFSPDDAKRLYVLCASNDGAYRLYQGDYSGDGSRLNYAYTGGSGGDSPQTPSDGYSWTPLVNLTTALASQAHYSTILYGGASSFLGASAIAISGDRVTLYNAYGGQDRPGWYMALSLSTGTITELVNTLNGDDGTATPSDIRWCGIHSFAAPEYPPDQSTVSCNQQFTPGTARNAAQWLMPPAMQIMKSGSYSSNTSLPWPIDSTYDNTCPADLAAQWQALGATGSNCAFFRITGEPRAEEYTVATLPAPPPLGGIGKITDGSTAADCTVGGGSFTNLCLWTGSAWIFFVNGSVGNDTVSLIEGDLFDDLSKYYTTFNPDTEHFRVVRRTAGPGGAIDLVVQRNAIPDYCNVPTASDGQHANGWRPFMISGKLRGCATWFAIKSAITTVEPVRDLIAGHFSIGIGPSIAAPVRFGNSTGIKDGTLASLQGPLPVTLTATYASTGWAGVASTVPQQGYLQVNTAQPKVMDMAAYNPSLGQNAETLGQTIGAVTVTNVSGHVYRVTALGGGSYKRDPLQGWSGRFNWTEQSSHTVLLTDTAGDYWKSCYTYADGECWAGSMAGQIYAVLPVYNAGGECLVGVSAVYQPCLIWQRPYGGSGFQRGITTEENAESVQRVSTQAGPWHYAYASLVPAPGGEYAYGHGGRWTEEGWYAKYLFRLPTHRPQSASTARSNGFVSVKVSGVAVGSVVSFGYNPSFYCLGTVSVSGGWDGRAEVCKVSAATIDQTAPYSFAHETLAGSVGTEIAIPAIAGSILYYSVSGGATQTVLVP